MTKKAAALLARLKADRQRSAAEITKTEKGLGETRAKVKQLESEIAAARASSRAEADALAGRVASGEPEGAVGRIRRWIKSAKITSVTEIDVAEAGAALMRTTITEDEQRVRDLTDELLWIERSIAVVESVQLTLETTKALATVEANVSKLAELRGRIGSGGPHMPTVRVGDFASWERLIAGARFQDKANRTLSNRATTAAWARCLGKPDAELEAACDPGRDHDLDRAIAVVDSWISQVTKPAQPAPLQDEVSA